MDQYQRVPLVSQSIWQRPRLPKPLASTKQPHSPEASGGCLRLDHHEAALETTSMDCGITLVAVARLCHVSFNSTLTSCKQPLGSGMLGEFLVLQEMTRGLSHVGRRIDLGFIDSGF